MADWARIRRGLGRAASPATMFLVVLCFGGTFLMVSCETPGGYGRAAPGGTTRYTGVDLATGSAPHVTPPERTRPPEERQDDRLDVQPLMALAFLLVVAGGVAGGLHWRRRHAVAASCAAAAIACLAAGILVARSSLADMIAAQVTRPLPPERTPTDLIQIGSSFWLALILLTAVAGGHGLALLSRRGDSPLAPRSRVRRRSPTARSPSG